MSKGLDLRRARRALRVLLADPDDTQQVFVIIDALSGQSPARNLRRLKRHAEGVRLLGQKPDLLRLLKDRVYLQSLPAGSLGRAYLEFITSEGITPEGLVEASNVPRGFKATDADLEYLKTRMRDSHDVWHAVTGYKGDLLGEGALLAFSFAQTWNPGVGLIIAAGFLRGGEIGIRRQILRGFVRGLRAAWLPEVEWEKLLSEPLDQVRSKLKVGAPVNYTPVRTSEFIEGALGAEKRAAS